MNELPFDARVSCTDGHCGTSVAVTLNPESWQISHIVVEDHAGNQRFVPLALVARSSRVEIWLDCTESAFKEMPLFLVTEYVERAPQQSGDWENEEGEWQDSIDVSSFEMTSDAYGVPLEVERVPEGEMSFHRHTDIEATDGHVGKVAALAVDLESGRLLALVLHKGHLWGKKHLMVPLAAVERFDADAVQLNVAKEAVDAFPAAAE